MSTYINDPTVSNAAPPPTVTAQKNVFQRIVGVLFAPAETFEDIVRKPNVLAPLLIFLAIGYVCTFALMPIMDWDSVVSAQTEQMRKQNPNMSDADIERISNMTRGFGKVMGYAGPLFGAIMWLIITGVFFLAFRLFGGEGTFGQAFSITIYSWVPLTVCSILMTIVAFARGSFDPTQAVTVVKSNPAFLVDMKAQPVLFAALSALDLFAIWSLILFIIGYAIMARVSKAKSAAIIVTLWAVYLVVKVGIAAMTAAKMAG